MAVNENRMHVGSESISARRSFWSALLFPTWSLAALALLLGLGISALSFVGIITPSRSLAYTSIGLLFSAFGLMFLAAHALDRRDAAEKEERLERVRQRGYEEGKSFPK